MTRIISGRAGGHRLRTPPGAGTRPTSDRVREALFSRLEHLGALEGARVLDLYAGSGALGLEAGSRGAADIHLVELNRAAASVARANAATIGALIEHATTRVHAEPVERFLLAGPRAGVPAGLVFLDPPYDLGEDLLADTLALLDSHGWLTADALVVVERSSRSPEPRWPGGLALLDERRHGETRLWFAEAVGPPEVA